MNPKKYTEGLKHIQSHAIEAYQSYGPNSARKCAEAVANFLLLQAVNPPQTDKLEIMLQAIEAQKLISTDDNLRKKITAYFRFLQTIGNVASHDNLLEKVAYRFGLEQTRLLRSRSFPAKSQ